MSGDFFAKFYKSTVVVPVGHYAAHDCLKGKWTMEVYFRISSFEIDSLRRSTTSFIPF